MKYVQDCLWFASQGLSEPQSAPCVVMQDRDILAHKQRTARRLCLTVPYLHSAMLELLMAQCCLCLGQVRSSQNKMLNLWGRKQ